MSPRSFVVVVLFALAPFACKREEPSITHDPVHERDVAEFEPAVDARTTSDSADAMAIDADAYVPPTLPALDDACKVDADCAVTFYQLDGPQTCCGRCGSTAGNRAWTTKIDAICGKTSGNPNCPAIDCPAGPMHAKCVGGKCVGVF